MMLHIDLQKFRELFSIQNLLIFQKVAAAGLILLIIAWISYRKKLGLESDIIWSALRCLVQLLFLGLVIGWIFSLKPVIGIPLAWSFMAWFAADIVRKRVMRTLKLNNTDKGETDYYREQLRDNLKYLMFLNLFLILLIFSIIMTVLIWLGKLDTSPQTLIPVGGMVIGNLVMALSLTYERLISELRARHQQIVGLLGLGMSSQEVIELIVPDVIRSVLAPRLDNLKATGLVWIPGLMTGLLIAKTSPVNAVSYQTMIMWILLANSFIGSMLGAKLLGRVLFDNMDRPLVR